MTWVGAAVFFGGTWGFVGYTVLWEGVPVQVDRPFVTSVLGSFLLLPVRLVIWGIHVAELAAGRTFDLSSNHRWIALAAAALGAVLAVGGVAAARALRRRARRS